MLKGSKTFEWIDKCEQAFQAPKEHTFAKANRRREAQALSHYFEGVSERNLDKGKRESAIASVLHE